MCNNIDFKCNRSTHRLLKLEVRRIRTPKKLAWTLRWGRNQTTQQKGFQSTQGSYERNQDISIIDGWESGSGGRKSKNTERVNLVRYRLITKKYKEYTEEYLKLLEAQQEEEKKAKEQGEVKVKSSLNSQNDSEIKNSSSMNQDKSFMSSSKSEA